MQTRFNTSDFTYHKDLKELTAELSDLPGTPAHRIYIKSDHTGKVITFEQDQTFYDDSHEDIYGWSYKPVMPRTCPNVKQVVIFND
jgi:hypothetical protein